MVKILGARRLWQSQMGWCREVVSRKSGLQEARRSCPPKAHNQNLCFSNPRRTTTTTTTASNISGLSKHGPERVAEQIPIKPTGDLCVFSSTQMNIYGCSRVGADPNRAYPVRLFSISRWVVTTKRCCWHTHPKKKQIHDYNLGRVE